MNNNLWAIAALSLIACGPNPGGNTDTTNSSCTECMVDSDGNEYPLGTGAIFVHATYELEQEVCQVLDEDGNVIGNTEEAIFGLDPGVFNFALGDPNETTLDGRPFHVTASGDYTTGNSSVDVIADKIAQAEILLELAPQYICGYSMCDYDPIPTNIPNTCESDITYDDKQWIARLADGALQGSQNNQFGSQGRDDDVWSLNDAGVLTYSGGDPVTVVTDIEYNTADQSWTYLMYNPELEFALTVSCVLEF